MGKQGAFKEWKWYLYKVLRYNKQWKFTDKRKLEKVFENVWVWLFICSNTFANTKDENETESEFVSLSSVIVITARRSSLSHHKHQTQRWENMSKMPWLNSGSQRNLNMSFSAFMLSEFAHRYFYPKFVQRSSSKLNIWYQSRIRQTCHYEMTEEKMFI